MPSRTLLLPSLNKIGPCMFKKWLGTRLSNKMATSRPSLIWSRNKMMCICNPSFLICVQSFNKISKCMSEKWLRTCSISGFFWFFSQQNGCQSATFESHCKTKSWVKSTSKIKNITSVTPWSPVGEVVS